MKNVQFSSGDIGLNLTSPRTMHIDLNSCFATIEQQANRRWRGRPVAVAAYDHPNGFILAASYEAKAMGITLGCRIKDAQRICPDIRITLTDPPKYREAHRRFRAVLLAFTDNVTAKSIDEFVLHLDDSLAIAEGQTMEQIGRAIKQAVYSGVGEAVNCNVGIGPNRFLAKLAAGLHKPNGLDVIDSTNIEQVFSSLQLVDLPGINRRYAARLKLAGIYTPSEFLAADRQLLRGAVFHGIVGHYWWLRLRGWEIDNAPTKRSQIGHQYSIPAQQRTPAMVRSILLRMSEKTGRRLRAQDLTARSIYVGVSYADHTHWHQSRRTTIALFASNDIFREVMRLFVQAPAGDIRRLDISVHDFAPANPEQLSFFDGERVLARNRDLARMADVVNARYGEFVLHPATMLGTGGIAKDAIAFGKLDDIDAEAD